MKKNLSVFQILKQGLSLPPSEKKFEKLPVSRKSSLDTTKPVASLSFTQLKTIKSSQKFNASDSESLSDKENVINDIESAKRRRKGSFEDFMQKEKHIKKTLNLKKEKLNQLLKREKIKVDGDDTIKPVSNFTKMVRKFNLDENLVRNLGSAGYKRPTAIQMVGIPAMFRVFSNRLLF